MVNLGTKNPEVKPEIPILKYLKSPAVVVSISRNTQNLIEAQRLKEEFFNLHDQLKQMRKSEDSLMMSVSDVVRRFDRLVMSHSKSGGAA